MWLKKVCLRYGENQIKINMSSNLSENQFYSLLFESIGGSQFTGIEKCGAPEALRAATPPKAINKLWFCIACKSC